jgi:hypothetical protein
VPEACELEFDEFVPLRMRSYRRPLGAGVLRLGNYSTTLLELLIEPISQVLRGVTVTSAGLLVPWPRISVSGDTEGLPVLSTDFEGWRVVDLPIDFKVAVREREILVFWDKLEECDAVTCGRFRFLISSARLAGLWCLGLTKDEENLFRSLAASP